MLDIDDQGLDVIDIGVRIEKRLTAQPIIALAKKEASKPMTRYRIGFCPAICAEGGIISNAICLPYVVTLS